MTRHKKTFAGVSNASKQGDARISRPIETPSPSQVARDHSIVSRGPQVEKFYARYPTYDPRSPSYIQPQDRVCKDPRQGYQ